MPLTDDVRMALLDPDRVWDTIAALPPAYAHMSHAHTHTTFSPNVAHGGQKTNIIPDLVELEVDIRTVPGTTRRTTSTRCSRTSSATSASHVEIGRLQDHDTSESPGARGNTLSDRACECWTQVT